MRCDVAVLGALHWTQPTAVADPQALASLRLFERLGGRFVQDDAATLQDRANAG
ncbi:MAG: hypothetical protein AB1773_09765 [Pseudomonadota bacterium]